MVSSSSLPASTFEKSRMSLMIVSSASPAPRTPSAYWRWRSSSSEFSSRPVRPMTPFMGVRISWLIVATNADFAREASRALSRVSASSRRASRSERSRRAVRMKASISRIVVPMASWMGCTPRPIRTSISTSAGGTTSGRMAMPSLVNVVSDSWWSMLSRVRWVRKPRAISTAPTSQPAFSQPSLKSESGSMRKPRSATSHRITPSANDADIALRARRLVRIRMTSASRIASAIG